MNPGATIRPRASNFSSATPRTLLGAAISATRPSRSRTSIGALIFAAGSITWPPLMRSDRGLDLSVAIQSIVQNSFRYFPISSGLAQSPRQNRHAYRDTVANLVDDDGVGTVNHFRRQLKATDYGPGMHDDRVPLGQLQPRRRHLIARHIVLQVDFPAGEAFLLHAQQH